MAARAGRPRRLLCHFCVLASVLAASAACHAASRRPAFLISGALGGLRGTRQPRLWQSAAAGRGARCAAGAGALEVESAVEPLGSYVLVKTNEPEEMTRGGILLPKQDKPKEGEVIAVGSGQTHVDSGVLTPVSVEPGESVVYSKYTGSSKLDSGGVEHVLIREDEILFSYTGAEATLGDLTMPRGKVLVKLLEGKKETDSGILLSKGAVEQTTTVGKVVAVGAGEVLQSGESLPPPVEVGDMVRFHYGDEVELDIDGDRFSAVKMSNCIAKWKVA